MFVVGTECVIELNRGFLFPRLLIRVNNLSTVEAKKYCENVRLGSMVTKVLVTQQNAVRASCTQMPKKPIATSLRYSFFLSQESF